MGKLNIYLSKYKNQLLAGLAVNLISLAHGTLSGWVSPTIHLLNSNNSPFSQSITIENESWIGSSVSLGGFSGTLLFGSILDRIGRKYTLFLLGIPNLCAWIIIFFSDEVYHLYIARYVTGLTGGGLYSTVPIFIAEIADNNIRGTLGSMLVLIVNIGFLLGYLLTTYLPYRMVPIVGVWIPIVFTLMVLYLEETPRFLLLNGKETKAEMSYKFYTNFNSDTKEGLQKFTNGFQELKNSLKNSIQEGSKRKLKDFTNPIAVKAIIAALIIVVLNQITGSFVILNFSTKMFAALGTALEPNLCTILMGVTQIIGTYFALMLVDNFGRRPLFILSLSGMLLGYLATGFYDYFDDIIDLHNFKWIPIVTLSFIVFSASLGVNPLTILIIIELVPGKIRSIVSMGCLLVLSCCAFTTLLTFPILMDCLQLYGVLWLCGFFCCTGILFIAFMIPETKGKILQEGGDPDEEQNKC